MGERLPPIHPGEILKAEFMEPLGLSARAGRADWGASQPHQPHLARVKGRHRGYGASSGSGFRGQSGILAEPSEAL